jgi:hypothetical protein
MFVSGTEVILSVGHAIAVAISRWVRAYVLSYGICGGQSGTGASLVRVFRFLMPVIPPTAPYSSSSIIRGLYNRPVSGRGPHPNKQEKLFNLYPVTFSFRSSLVLRSQTKNVFKPY